MKVRGSAQQVVEKYLALAREAATSGDRVMAENYYQHAEHYFRLQNGHNAPQPQAANPSGNGHDEPGPQRGPGGGANGEDDQPAVSAPRAGDDGAGEAAETETPSAAESGESQAEAPQPRRRKPRTRRAGVGSAEEPAEQPS